MTQSQWWDNGNMDNKYNMDVIAQSQSQWANERHAACQTWLKVWPPRKNWTLWFLWLFLSLTHSQIPVMLTTGNDVWFMEKPSGGFHLPYMERNCVHRGRGVLRCPVSGVHAKWHKLKWPAFTQLNKILISDRNSISVGRIDWGGDWGFHTLNS